jgi:hypothetical protein
MTDVPNVPSKEAAMMLSELADMTGEQIDIVHDLGISIASNVESATANIENPTKKRAKGCEIIHLGSHLFVPIRDLKQSLEDGNIDLEGYLRQLNTITDSLCDIVDKNNIVMGNPKVRDHMKRLTNTIILGVEAGVVINTMFSILAREEDGDFPA